MKLTTLKTDPIHTDVVYMTVCALKFWQIKIKKYSFTFSKNTNKIEKSLISEKFYA